MDSNTRFSACRSDEHTVLYINGYTKSILMHDPISEGYYKGLSKSVRFWPYLKMAVKFKMAEFKIFALNRSNYVQFQLLAKVFSKMSANFKLATNIIVSHFVQG
jgi:hypothetical protein